MRENPRPQSIKSGNDSLNRIVIFVLLIVLATVQFLYNRSLWLDESMLALDIRSSSYGQLLQPLGYVQVAPIGYLFLVKTSLVIFGSASELAFRLPVFIIGLIAFYLIYKRKDVFSTPSMAFILVNTVLIYYSSEVKQYIFDFFFATILIIQLYDKRILACMITLAIGVWFCNTPFILLLPLAVITLLYERWWPLTKKLLLSAGILVVSVGFYYLKFVKDHPSRNAMFAFHVQNMGLLGNNSLVAFLKNALNGFLELTPANHYLTSIHKDNYGYLLTLLILLAMAWYCWRNRQKPVYLFGLLAIGTHVVFAMFNQYPIGKRFYLDLFPIAAVYFSTLPFDKLKPAQANLSFYVLLLIALVPFFTMRHPSKFPFRIEPARETANYLKQHSVDTVYIDRDVDFSPSLKFYAPGLQHIVVDDAGKVPANAVFISKIDDSLAKDPRFTVDTTFNYTFGVMILTRK